MGLISMLIRKNTKFFPCTIWSTRRGTRKMGYRTKTNKTNQNKPTKEKEELVQVV